jgi:hypothetical protein
MSELQFHQQHQQWAELEYVHPPIPTRSHDWRAVMKGSAEPEDPQGYGATPEEALRELREEVEWRKWEDRELERQERMKDQDQ